MAQKKGNGGHGLENYDPNTGKYVKSDRPGDFVLGDSDSDLLSLIKRDPNNRKRKLSFSQIIKDIEAYKQFYKIEGEHELEDDYKVVNHREDPSYKNNCTHCAIAYEFRRRGYDVEALPCEKGPDESDYFKNGGWENDFVKEDIYSKYSIWGNRWEKFGSDKKEDMAQWLYDSMLKEGEGARFFVSVNWSLFSGHAFNAEVKNGTVYIVDSQSKIKYNLAIWERWAFDEKYSDLCIPSETKFIRVDNKAFDMSNINKAITNKRR